MLHLLEQAKQQGENVTEYEERVKQLMIEMAFIGDMLLPKYRAMIRLRYEMLFRLQPEYVTRYHKMKYEDMTDETRHVKRVSQLTKQYISDTTAELKIDFKATATSQIVDELLSYLIKDEYIDPKTRKKTFVNLLQLKGVPKEDRIVWIRRTRRSGVIAIKPLLLVLNQLFTRLRENKHEVNGWEYLIRRFFKAENGEIPTGSVKTLRSNIDDFGERDAKLFKLLPELVDKYRDKS